MTEGDLMSEFQGYRRSQIAELREWRPGDDMTGVSIGLEDTRAGSPKAGDMIARNPANHADKWLVAAAYFAANFETATGAAQKGEQFGIGQAVKEMRNGNRVARAGWNGKGMYLAYQPGYPDGIPINANTAKATGQPEGTVLRFLPYVTMRTADGSFVPWLCSQTDLLAVDWELVA